MRGGTAHCTVVISDEPIGSPLVKRPGAVVALNQPSFVKYEPLVRPGGIVVYNSSLVNVTPQRNDIRYVAVPGNAIAESLGNVRQANVVLVGALLQVTGALPLEVVEATLDARLPERQRKYLESNKVALRRGADIAAVLPAATLAQQGG
jgi:2-oxoglutarate ferredoxin oxidoreductase subunit gamma